MLSLPKLGRPLSRTLDSVGFQRGRRTPSATGHGRALRSLPRRSPPLTAPSTAEPRGSETSKIPPFRAGEISTAAADPSASVALTLSTGEGGVSKFCVYTSMSVCGDGVIDWLAMRGVGESGCCL